MSIYTSMVDRLLWPAWERGIRGRPTPTLLAQLRASEGASLESLRDGQITALRALLAHAAEASPHYVRGIREAGLDPSRVGFESFSRLPILTRRAAQSSLEERLSTRPPKATIRKTTGGTTGEPLVIRYDANSEHWRQAIKLRGFGWAGFRVGAPSLHYWGASSTAVGRGSQIKQRADRLLKRETWIDCNQQDDASRIAAARIISREQPEYLFAYAQAAADLARFINRRGLRDWREVRVIAGAEKIYPDDREELERAFGEVFETYGCREVMLIGCECDRHDGLHISMENLIVEIVDDEGQPSRPGDVGRVVLTDLHNFGCPFIRYANGDLAVAVADDDVCGCGRAHPRLRSIEGRSTETLRDADGAPVGGMVFNLVFSPLAEHVQQFQVVQRADSSITVRVVPAKIELAPNAYEHLSKTAERYLPNIPIKIEIVDDIPLSASGKKRVVIVES